MTARRIAARLLYRAGPVCFACGRWSAEPCAGHEYGGVILGWRRRRWAPFRLARFVDCRWYL